MSQHSDPDYLALLALGERVPADVTDHVATCPSCAAELDSFTSVVGTARTARDEDALVAPAPSVWAGIERELGLGSADAGPASTVVTDVDLSRAAAPSSNDAEVVDLASRRARRPWPWIAAAAAAGVLVGGVGGSWIVNRAVTGPAPTVLAQAPLDPLPNWEGASGNAVVKVAADGSRTLVLDVEGDVPDDGFREVWLIDRDVTRLVSIGVLEGSRGTFVIPSGIDLSDFAVVDVSQEHLDGDPAHSGDSIVRGLLDT